jgi:zinc D-Ala-D-Ala dipeptidase
VQHAEASIIIYDSLRPLRAGKDFIQWLDKAPVDKYELLRKKLHYPHIDKNKLAKLGYLSVSVSGHCYGNVVDISLVRLEDGTELNMGAIFDYFDEFSHVNASARVIGAEAYENRMLLINGMQQFGFSVYSKEFWHFVYLKQEVDVPFDLEINETLRGLNA